MRLRLLLQRASRNRIIAGPERPGARVTPTHPLLPLLWGSEPRCPECSAVLDAATHMYDRRSQPRPGDVSLCLYCGTALRYGPNLRLQRLTDTEFMALPADTREELRKHQFALACAVAPLGPLRPGK